MELARRILLVRKQQLGLKQREFAHRLGVEPMTVSRWERGVSPPSIQNLRAIASLAGRPVAWFYEDDEQNGAAA